MGGCGSDGEGSAVADGVGGDDVDDVGTELDVVPDGDAVGDDDAGDAGVDDEHAATDVSAAASASDASRRRVTAPRAG